MTVKNLNVLWLEDVPKSIRANVFVLEEAGFSVEVVMSLQDAIDSAKRTEYEIIFVDYSVPSTKDSGVETNKGLGLKFITMLKNSELGARNATATTILCTAQTESIGYDRADLERFGVDILPKSSSYTSIVEMIDEYKRVL